MKDTIFLCYWQSSKSDDHTRLFTLLQEQAMQMTGFTAATGDNNNHCAILVSVPDKKDKQSQIEQIQKHALELHLELSVLEMAVDAVTIEEQESPENGLIITLLANEFSADAIVEVMATGLAQNLKPESLALISPANAAPAVQIRMSGSASGPDWNSLFTSVRDNYSIDVMVQKDDKWRTRRRMVCFDMDSTIIKVEVIDELARHAGVGDQVAGITERAMRGELDFKQSFSGRMALLNGLSESVLESIAQELPIMDGAEHLFRNLRAHGFKTAILSGGFTYFAKVLQNKLGVDYVFANSLEIEDGKLSGRAIEPIIDGQAKANLLIELAAKEGFQTEEMVAVGDGANDLPMLANAGMGVAFRAKPLVREQAEFSMATHGLDGLLYLLGQPV